MHFPNNKKVKGKNEMTGIYDVNVFKAIDEINWKRLTCILAIPLPV